MAKAPSRPDGEKKVFLVNTAGPIGSHRKKKKKEPGSHLIPHTKINPESIIDLNVKSKPMFLGENITEYFHSLEKDVDF